LYGEVRDRLAEVTGLQAASAALAEELLPERALRVLAQQALSLSGAATVSIELLREGGRELEVQVAVGEHALELASMRVPVEGSLAGTAVSSGRPQIVRPASSDGICPEGLTPAERTSARSLLVLPLRARGRTLGTLSAYTHHPDAFHSRQVELLATFANQAAISLDNARLYGELHSRLEEMVGLQRLGTLLLEEHDFDRVLQSRCRPIGRCVARRAHPHRGLVCGRSAAHQSLATQRRRPERPARLQEEPHSGQHAHDSVGADEDAPADRRRAQRLQQGR
jgi:GAF domain-containing protein